MTDPHAVQPPVLELEQIDGLVAAAGVAGAQEILQTFWQSTESLLEHLVVQIGEGDAEQAAKTAHALKGSAANVGARRLAELAKNIEECCMKADRGDPAHCLGKAQEVFAETRSAFEAHLAAA
ncbi:MAG: Hpt domain-containing protein [Parvularculaceae bacterium]